jgi:hypothetical protein
MIIPALARAEAERANKTAAITISIFAPITRARASV